jgi:hypothetical protein
MPDRTIPWTTGGQSSGWPQSLMQPGQCGEWTTRTVRTIRRDCTAARPAPVFQDRAEQLCDCPSVAAAWAT